MSDWSFPDIDLHSLPWRLVLYIVVPVVLVLLAVGFGVLRTLERQFETRMEEEVEMVARSLKLPVGHAIERQRPETLAQSLKSAIQIGRVYGVYLYGRDGELRVAIGEDRQTVAPSPTPTAGAPRTRTGRYERVAGEQVYSYFVPVSDSADNIVGFLQVTRQRADFLAFLSHLRRIGALFVVATGVIVTLIIVLGYWRAAGRALDRLDTSMKRIADGDRAHRPEPEGPREIARLTEMLNEMLTSIEEAEVEIQRQRETRAELQDELRESEEMAAIGRVSAGVAHELGTPLSTVSGRVQRLLRTPDLPEKVQRAATIVDRETQRMRDIIEQLLDFGRSGKGRRNTMPLGDIVETALRTLHPEADDSGLEIRPDPLPEGPEVHVRRTRIEQAVANLIANASEASPGGTVHLGFRTEGDYAVLTVEDDGPGINAQTADQTAGQTADQLFEPFYTTKSDSGGTGLGLAIVHAVAREHGGGVRVGDSSRLGGARFELYLHRKGEPLSPPDSDSAAFQPPNAPERPFDSSSSPTHQPSPDQS